jgi:hypothetical protein
VPPATTTAPPPPPVTPQPGHTRWPRHHWWYNYLPRVFVPRRSL